MDRAQREGKGSQGPRTPPAVGYCLNAWLFPSRTGWFSLLKARGETQQAGISNPNVLRALACTK
jgi:hypothetical protein